MEKKTEIPGLYKVCEGIIINKDNNALALYKNKKLREKKLDTIHEEFASLKDEVSEIKELLKALINSKKD
jgi:hypothetical protein